MWFSMVERKGKAGISSENLDEWPRKAHLTEHGRRPATFRHAATADRLQHRTALCRDPGPRGWIDLGRNAGQSPLGKFAGRPALSSSSAGGGGFLWPLAGPACGDFVSAGV